MKTKTTFLALAALGAVAGAYVKWLRPWHLNWGATDEELAMPLPGDEFASVSDVDSTHAITIDAPPEDVWPWIAQLGQHRAGFYSYRWLENLAGCHMPDAREVISEWQDVKAGDKLWLHPKVALDVLLVEPEREFVMGTVWGFHLRPVDEGVPRGSSCGGVAASIPTWGRWATCSTGGSSSSRRTSSWSAR